MSRTRPVPDFVCIGAARAGTTALYGWLSQHPDICVSTIKEPNYFSWDQISSGGPGDADSLPHVATASAMPSNRHAARVTTAEAYLSLFPDSSERITGEVSPSYLFYSSVCAPRIAAHAPQAKIIAILRDPVERAISNYLFLRKLGRETKPFDLALQLEETRLRSGWEHIWSYYGLGLYHRQLRDYLAYFPRKSMLIMLYEEIERFPRACLGRILSFLGVRQHEIGTAMFVNTSYPDRGPLFELAMKLRLRRAVRMLPGTAADAVRRWDHRLAQRRSRAAGTDIRSAVLMLRERYQDEVARLKADFPDLPIERYWSCST